MRIVKIDADRCSVSEEQFTIGRQDEHEYTEIQFHFPEWAEEWPGATFSAVYWRPDGKETIIAAGVSESPICWRPTRTDLAVKGRGVVELRMSSGETRGKKPPINVYIKPTPRESEDAPEGESPEAAG